MYKNRRGQGLVEYALVICLISLIAVVSLTALGDSISAMLGVLESLKKIF